ncbi:MAG: hypothetical protein JO243_16260 [Solirubrobacterales bacterium]|nr:hypothetical protein [Solirubrobacterales bacterium]
MAWSVEVGLGVLGELLEAEVEEIVGPKGKHNPDRVAVRHGQEDGGGGARGTAGRGQPAAGQDGGQRVGGSTPDL